MEVQHFCGFPCFVFLLVFVSYAPIQLNVCTSGVVREMQQQNNNYASCAVHLRARKASKTHAKHPHIFCITALFTNTQTLKIKSRLHNCVFCCCQS